MSGDNETEAVTPAWGALPVEQYLIPKLRCADLARQEVDRRLLLLLLLILGGGGWRERLGDGQFQCVQQVLLLDEAVQRGGVLAGPVNLAGIFETLAMGMSPWAGAPLGLLVAAPYGAYGAPFDLSGAFEVPLLPFEV